MRNPDIILIRKPKENRVLVRIGTIRKKILKLLWMKYGARVKWIHLAWDGIQCSHTDI
jgi:hypothetical protein